MAENSLKLRIQAIVKGARDVLGLNKAVDQLGKESTDTAKETQQLNKELDKQESSSGEAAKGIKGLATAMKSVAAAAVAKVFIQTNAALEGMEKGFELVTGSAEKAKQEMAFVRNEAQRLGIDVRSASDAYLSLTAAAKGTSIEGEETRKIFVSIANAMGRLGKSSADSEGALRAVQQMLSKGKVSAEELRGQLGERLPGAFQAASRAIGVTTQELDKMLQGGEIIAEEFLPKFAIELDKTFGSTEKIKTFNASWQRFLNTLGFAAQEGQKATGAMGLLQAALDKTATGINFITLALTAMSAEFVAAGKSIGAFFAFISGNTSWEEFKQNADAAFSEATAKIDAARDRIAEFDQSLQKTNKTLLEVAQSGKIVQESFGLMARGFSFIKQKTEQLNAAIERHIVVLPSLKDAMAALSNETVKAARAQTKNTIEQAKGAKSSFDLALAMVRLIEQKKKLNQLMQSGVISQKEYNTQIQEVENTTENVVQQQQQQIETQKGVQKGNKGVADSTKEAGDRTKVFNEVIIDTSTVMDKMIAHLKFWQDEMDGLSESARNAFDSMLENINRAGGAMVTSFDASTKAAQDNSAEIASLSRQIDHMRSAYDQATGDVNRWMIAVEAAGLAVKRSFLQQEDAAAKLEQRLEGLKSLTEEEANSLKQAATSFTLLDKTRLDGITSRIEQLRAATEALNDSALATLTSLQNELDRMNGNLAAIEARNYELKRLELIEQINAAQAAGDAVALARLKQSLVLLDKIHRIKMANLNADIEASKVQADTNAASSGGSSQFTSGGTSRGTAGSTVKASGNIETQINLDGKEIARVVQPYISEFGRLSG